MDIEVEFRAVELVENKSSYCERGGMEEGFILRLTRFVVTCLSTHLLFVIAARLHHDSHARKHADARLRLMCLGITARNAQRTHK